MPEYVNSADAVQAAEDFNKIRNKALVSRIQNLLTAQQDDLMSLDDVKNILKPHNQTYKGMQTVPVNLIVGSEGRSQDFNRNFQPRKEFMRQRWTSVDRAQMQSVTLPPIQLYEIGGAYFVRDGNHRVSVAKMQGIEQIDAEVTSLSSEVEIHPGETTDDLKAAVLDYEKRLFYANTFYGDITDDWKLDFSRPGRYDEVLQHILGHKYFLNQAKSEEIPLSEAILSWYGEVYTPIIAVIRRRLLTAYFPGKLPSDLYLMIVKSWDFLKKKTQHTGEDYTVEDAARIFARRYGVTKGLRPRLFHAWLHRNKK
jgi:hypothetical protein